MFVTIENILYVKWEESGMCEDDEYITYVKFSKKKQKYIISNSPKMSKKYVLASLVGENTDIVTKVINSKKDYISYNTELKEIQKWTKFNFTEKDPVILGLLIDGSYVESNDVWIPVFWCWNNLFEKFHNLSLLKINNEICVELNDWVQNTHKLKQRFGRNSSDFFEHDDGPGASDVEIVNDDIYVKVLYIFKYKHT